MRKIIATIIVFVMLFFLGKHLITRSIRQISEPTAKNVAVQTHTSETPKKNMYHIEADYNGENKIQSIMSLKYFNKTGQTQANLFFHMYPNIFKSRNHLPFFAEDFNQIFPKGFSSGYLDILEAVQGDEPLSWSAVEDDQILQLDLKKPVKPGEHTEINIVFCLTIPNANFRFGYQEFGQDKITVSLGNWYPILAVFENGNWALDKHCAIGDPGYSDVSDYKVKFTTPCDFTAAASGILENCHIDGDKAVHDYSAENIRDFAASLSNNYQTAEGMIDGIKIISYFHPEDKKGGFMALNTVKHALKIYNKSFGSYPYAELRIAEANYYCGGMEYPMFIMMDTRKYKEPNLSNTSLERSTAHEVAHQWWYGVVGNNQVKEPWIDEGITEFSTAYYFEKRYGSAGREAYFERQVNTVRNIIDHSKMRMYDALPEFKIRREYFPVVYINGVLFFEDMRAQIGDEHLSDLLKSYYEKYKYKNVNLDEFKKYLREQTQDVLDDSFFEKWFNF